MTRREFTKKQKAEIVMRAMNADGLVVCEGCGLILAAKKYDIDHVVPEALVVDKSKPLTTKDGQLLGVACCHRGGRNKTADDVRRIAKAVRQRDKIGLGIRQTSSPMPGSKGSKWKRKVSGETVLR